MAKHKKKFWIKSAIRKKGALRKTLKAKKGKKISAKSLRKATKSRSLKTKRRAVLARTLRRFARKRKKG
jgi:hypothetical protein